MDRRTLLSGVGTTASVSIAGCLGRRVRSSSEANQHGLEEQELPEKPDPLTQENAGPFVTDYEKVKTYNEMVTEDTTELTVSCPAAVEFENEKGFYLSTVCRGGSTVENKDGTVLEGSFGPWARFYFVSDDHVQRIDERRDESGSSYGSGRGGRELQGFRLVNFDESEHNTTVEITNPDRDDESVLEAEYRLDSEAYIARSGVTAIEGVYDVIVTLETGSTATYEWTIDDIVPVFGYHIYITRDGELQFGTNTDPGR